MTKKIDKIFVQNLSDKELRAARTNLAKNLKLAEAMDLADMVASRHDSSYLAEDTLYKNFDKIQNIKRIQGLVKDEIETRGLDNE